MRVTVTINGQERSADVEPRVLLVDLIRSNLALTGTHVGCEHGVCGACTIRLDGRVVRSCIAFAVQADGAEIETIEGVSRDGELTAVQHAFHEQHGLQCGYCTPGLVMAATFLLRRNPNPTEEEIRRAIRGNICRCTGYVNIVRSIAAATASGETA